MDANLLKCCCSAPNSAAPYHFDEAQGSWVQDETAPGRTSEVSVWAQTRAMGVHAAMVQQTAATPAPAATSSSSDSNGALLGKVLGSTLGFVVVASLGGLAWRQMGKPGTDKLGGEEDSAKDSKAPRRLSLAFMDVARQAVSSDLVIGPADDPGGAALVSSQPPLTLQSALVHRPANPSDSDALKTFTVDAHNIMPTEYVQSQRGWSHYGPSGLSTVSSSAQMMSDLVLVEDVQGLLPPRSLQILQLPPTLSLYPGMDRSARLQALDPIYLNAEDSNWPRIMPVEYHSARGG